jgi:AraC-like DNA-binding protein
MSYSISELLCYFGGILGIILSIVILTISKGKKEIKISLATVLIVASFMIILGAFNYSGKIINFIHLIRVDSPIHFLFSPAVYLYTLATFNTNFKYRKIHLLHLLPFLVNIIQFLPLYFSSTAFKLSYYNELHLHGTIVIPMLYLMKTISLLVYFIAQLYLAVKFKIIKTLLDKSNRQLKSWFLIYFSSQFILIAGLLVDHLSSLSLFADPYRFGINMVAIFLYLTVVALLFFPSLLYGYVYFENSNKEKYSNSKLSNQWKYDVLNKLNIYIKSDEKPFLNVKLTLLEVATNLNVSSQQLSQVINEQNNLNFNDFINSYRIEESKDLLISTSYSNLTIDAIAQKSGFNSKSTFYTAFKKHVGATPKEYIISNQIPIQLDSSF